MSQLSIKLNQQNYTKGAQSQDYSFLKEASPIYVTSLTANHVTGTTTVTAGSSHNCTTGPNNHHQHHHQQQQQSKHNNNQQQQSLPLAVSKLKPHQQLQSFLCQPTAVAINQLTHQVLINHQQQQQPSPVVVLQQHNQSTTTTPSAPATGNSTSGGSSIVTTVVAAATQTNQQQLNNINNNNLNNNNSNNCNTGAGNTLSYNYGCSLGSEILANGHGPRRELTTLSEGDSEPPEESFQPKSISKGTQVITTGGNEVLLGDPTALRPDIRFLSNIPILPPALFEDADPNEHCKSPRPRSGSSIVVVGEKPRLPDEYLSHVDLQTDSTAVDIEMLTMLSVNQDNGPHREMAVDVPDTFIARNKTPPRYPPPRPPVQVNHTPNGAMPQLSKFHHHHHSGGSNSLVDSIDNGDTSGGGGGGGSSAHSGTSVESLNVLGSMSGTGGSIGGGVGGGDVSLELQPLDSFAGSIGGGGGGGGGGSSIGGAGSMHGNASHAVMHKASSSLDSCCNDTILMEQEFIKKLSSKGPSSIGSQCESIGFDSMSFRTKLRGSLSTRSSSSGDLGPPEYDLGPHRELPVDVPETFVEMVKSPPRYPPPKPQIIKETVKAKSSLSSSGSIEKQMPQPQAPPTPVRNSELNGSAKPVPPPRDHLRIEKDGRLVNRAPAPQVPDRKTSIVTTSSGNSHNNQIAHIVEPTLEQLDSIKKYQEQLRRRREEEDRIAQQNEFLRASLRGSRKLQALTQDGIAAERPSGVDNDAYLEDEDVERIVGYSELVGALGKLQNQLNKSGYPNLAGRVTAAQSLLLGPGVARALTIRSVVLQRRRPRIQNPICSNAQALAKDCVESLAQSNSSLAIELCDLLSTYEMEGLLQAHDRVATTTDRSPASVLLAPPLDTLPVSKSQNSNLVNNNILKREPINTPHGVLREPQDPIRIIQIEKSSEPLGATIRNEGEAVVIGRIVRGGAAEKSGLLHEGDELLEVNGIEMRGKSVNDVCLLLAAMTGTLTFLIVPAGLPPPGGTRDPPVLHVRSHFDYDPEDDLYIPCRELGISFQKGDVMHVISREDPHWWQAYREGEEDQTLAGLIPSQSFHHLRESTKLAIAGEAGLGRHHHRGGKEMGKGSTLLCARKGRKKKKKASSEAGYPLYATTTTDDPDPEEILTYEEVALYYPRPTHKRPIVLIGPPNIGRHELRQRLMADSDRFAAAVPHTSRPRRDGEVPGQDYHFISRAQFEADILARKFVEHGEYEKAYYGTSLEAIRAVVSSSKICVLNLHPQSLKLLRASDLKPYVVLVAPPALAKLRQKKLNKDEPFKEEELKDIIATARDMEARWGHLFDMIIINSDTERAYNQLLLEINSLEREPQWVPASWIHNN